MKKIFVALFLATFFSCFALSSCAEQGNTGNFDFSGKTESEINAEIDSASESMSERESEFISESESISERESEFISESESISECESVSESESISESESESESVNPHGHEIIEKEIIDREPTCTAVGIKYIVCEVCNELLRTVIIEKAPHDYNEVITPPSCTEQGYTTFTCKVCGSITVGSYVAATGHSYSEEYSFDDNHHWQEPTCGHLDAVVKAAHELDEDGICTICGYDSNVTLALKYVEINGGTEYAVDELEDENVKTVYIPNTYNGKPVTKINEMVFYGNKTLEKIVMGDNIVEMGASAFYECSSLKTVKLSSSLTSIDNNAFYGCHNLRNIEIPDGVTSIGSFAFSNCSSLTSVTIGNGVTSIGEWAFFDCYRLTSIVLPDSVTSIGSSAFFDCSSLTSIEIPNSVTSIGSSAFSNCPCVKTTKGVSYVDKWLVDCNEAVTSVTIKADTVGIADYAFSGCSSLTSIEIPDSVTSIEYGAFSYCSSLTSVYYAGSESEWNEIAIGNTYNYNRYLLNATRYYYSEEEPAESGNYWHYNDNGEIVVW